MPDGPAPPAPAADERLARLRLARGARIGPVAFQEALAHFGSARAACRALPAATPQDIEREEGRLAAAGGRFLVLGDPDYPGQLAALPDAPPVLAALGNLPLLQRPMLAIVGARQASTIRSLSAGVTLA